mgnify:CR=1 FL=1
MANLQKDLLELGFSLRDTEVYLSLVKEGPCAAGPLIKDTGLHRNIIYTSLNHLIARNLVDEKIEKGKKIFSILSPEALVSDFSYKAELAKEVSEKKQKRSKITNSDLTVYKSVDDFWKQILEVAYALPEKDTVYVFGALTEGVGWRSVLQYSSEFYKLAIKRGVQFQILTSGTRRKGVRNYYKKEFGKVKAEIRYLPVGFHKRKMMIGFPVVDTLVYLFFFDDGRMLTALMFKNVSMTFVKINA